MALKLESRSRLFDECAESERLLKSVLTPTLEVKCEFSGLNLHDWRLTLLIWSQVSVETLHLWFFPAVSIANSTVKKRIHFFFLLPLYNK